MNYPPMDAKWMEEGELAESPNVLKLYLEAFDLQPTLTPGISKLRLIWISDADYHGYAVDFLSLSMHAISRDLEAYPLPCIYTQIETDDEFDYVDDAGDELSDYQDSNNLSRVQEMRLVPSDPSVLDNLFKVLCDCALLNPDPVQEHEGEGEWFFNEEEVLAGAIGHSNGVKDHDVTGFSELHLDDEQFDDAEESEGEHPA
ncbi:hypothetical protein L7F22_059486 [Adiantum nelumboides]|nr:hypothetical protein [Adiantum nelumboides]